MDTLGENKCFCFLLHIRQKKLLCVDQPNIVIEQLLHCFNNPFVVPGIIVEPALKSLLAEPATVVEKVTF